jgi:exodeoxyribonuclease III
VTLTVTAWNVRQGGGERAQRIVDAIATLQTDVAILSEWRANARNGLAARLEAAGFVHQVARPDPLGKYASILVASRRRIEVGPIVYTDVDDGHRFCHVVVDGWSIGGAYIPGHEDWNDRKQRFWSFILATWAEQVAGPALLCGDLNTGLWYRDEPGATLCCHDQHAALEHAGWRDAWIERNRQARPPATWFSPTGNGFRLDHALLSPNAPRSRRVDYPREIGDASVLGRGGLSDHLPLVISLPEISAGTRVR